MGSLPALYVQPPQDPTQGLERAVSLRNLLQNAPIQHQILQQQAQAGALENQQRQMALKDQQAMTAAMQQWDGKNYDDLPGLVLKQGGSAQAVMGLKSNLLQYRTGLANLTKDQLAAEKTKNDYFAQAIDNVKSLPQEQQAAAFEAAKQDAVQKGHLDPQQAQGLTYQGPQQLDLLEKSLKGHDSVIEQSLKEQQTKEAAAKTEEATSAAAKNNMEVAAGGTGAMADSRYRNILMKPAAQRTAEDNAFVKAYEKQKTLVPTANFNLQNNAAPEDRDATAHALADGSMKWSDILQARTPLATKIDILKRVKAINPQYSSGDFDVEKRVREAYTSGSQGQQLTAINTAREHMKTFKDTADALKNGNFLVANRVGQWLGTQFGGDKATNFNVARTAFAGEVGKAFAGASVGVQDRQELIDKINQASSWDQLKGYADTADKLLEGKQKSLKESYTQGMQGNPNFGGNTERQSGDFFSKFGGQAK